MSAGSVAIAGGAPRVDAGDSGPGDSGLRTPGAIVVGGDYQGLGIVRSLGRRGIEVIVLDDERSISRRSRYATDSVRVPDLHDEHAAVAALLALVQERDLDGWVVFATREETVAALSRNRELLGARLRIPTPAWDVVKWAWDKRNTYRLAGELGIPTPRSWTLRGEQDLACVDADPPFAVKPAIKEHFLYATGKKAWLAETREQLRERVREAAGVVGEGEVIVQEVIPGAGDTQLAYCAFFRDGEPAASMTVRRLRQHPPLFGRASTFVQTAELPELEALSERFLRHIGYYGLVELEYKHDIRDGRTKLLDVNARTWGYHSLGQRAGIDFPFLLYADQVAQRPDGPRAAPAPHPPAALRAPSGVSWVRLATDLPVALGELARGRLGPRSYLRSLLGADVESVFSRDDPAPGLAELALLPYLAVRRGF